jgi:hypothetical protein
LGEDRGVTITITPALVGLTFAVIFAAIIAVVMLSEIKRG